jgi:uncharacterized RDD family membrane protein YckC
VNTICSQCGAVLSRGARSCIFCDTSESSAPSEHSSATLGNLALNAVTDAEWRGELNQRVQAYRARRRKRDGNDGQTELPFAHRESSPPANVGVQVEEPLPESKPAVDDFSFTIAIGRSAQGRAEDVLDTQYVIDVSLPAQSKEADQSAPVAPPLPESSSLYPVASLDERRSAAWIDIGCLAFAYGGFLALFGSLGGHFTFSKLNAAVYFFTFAFVYLQYFGLFTIFGGTTPGMMIRGLQVATFSGFEPTLRHLLLRALGYVLSAGTLFLGFMWSMWDEDALTWHDRLSGTYLRAPELLTDMEESQPAPSH